MQEAAYNYADAWHRLHMELMGEHELAAKGADAERFRKAGPEAKRNQAALRSAIIALAYMKFAADEPDATRRTSPKYAAEVIIDMSTTRCAVADWTPSRLARSRTNCRPSSRQRRQNRLSRTQIGQFV
jgi:hypothetical protein